MEHERTHTGREESVYMSTNSTVTKFLEARKGDIQEKKKKKNPASADADNEYNYNIDGNRALHGPSKAPLRHV